MAGSLEMSQDEEFVYRLLLKNPNLSVSDLSETLDWPPERVTAAFNKMIHLSSLDPESEVSKSRITQIRSSLISFLDRQEEELIRRQKEIATSRQVIFQLLAEYAETDTGDRHPRTRRLEGREAIQSLIRTMADTCTSEVAVFATGEVSRPRAWKRPSRSTPPSWNGVCECATCTSTVSATTEPPPRTRSG